MKPFKMIKIRGRDQGHNGIGEDIMVETKDIMVGKNIMGETKDIMI